MASVIGRAAANGADFQTGLAKQALSLIGFEASC
jgi:hypothetical protein